MHKQAALTIANRERRLAVMVTWAGDQIVAVPCLDALAAELGGNIGGAASVRTRGLHRQASVTSDTVWRRRGAPVENRRLSLWPGLKIICGMDVCCRHSMPW